MFPEPALTIAVLPDVIVPFVIVSVPKSVFVIVVPPVFSIFPYVLEFSSPFPLSFISNVPLLVI